MGGMGKELRQSRFKSVLPGERIVDTPKEILTKIQELKRFMDEKIEQLSQCRASLDGVTSGKELNKVLDNWVKIKKDS